MIVRRQASKQKTKTHRPKSKLKNAYMLLIQNTCASNMDPIEVETVVEEINDIIADNTANPQIIRQAIPTGWENIKTMTMENITNKLYRKIDKRPHTLLIPGTEWNENDNMDWLEWMIPTKPQRHDGDEKKDKQTAADIVSNHPRLAGIVGILPPLTMRKDHNEFILSIKETTKNEIRRNIMQTIITIIMIRQQHRKQKWPPDIRR